MKLKFKHKIFNIKFFSSYYQYLILIKKATNPLLLTNSHFYMTKKKRLLDFHFFFIFYVTPHQKNWIHNLLLKFRLWNRFTQRGFRLSRTALKTKIGKLSAYKMFKSKIF